MKTIKELIEMSEGRLAAERQIQRDNRVAEVYRKFPDLADLDGQILSVRKSRLVSLLDDSKDFEARFSREEEALENKRDKFLRDHNIDPDFDTEKFICGKCSDTGFVKGKDGTLRVCDCRADDVEECFETSGLADYSSFKMNNYRADYFGDAMGRGKIMKAMLGVVLGAGSPVWIYSDGAQTGKTFMSVVVAKGAVNLGKSVFYTKCEALEDYADDLDDLKRCDILFIDDFADDITLRRDVGTVLNSVLEVRAASGLKTILVTSIPKSALVSGCDMRISGKIKNADLIIPESRK